MASSHSSTASNRSNDLQGLEDATLCEVLDLARKLGIESERLLKEKDRELSSLKQRTAEIAGAQMNRGDMSGVENITDNDRLSVLQEDYKIFSDEAQMDAVDRLDKLKHMDNTDKVRLACRVFEIVYEVTCAALGSLRGHFEAILSNPSSSTRKDKQGKQCYELVCVPLEDGKVRELQEEMNSHLSNYLKKTSNNVHVEKIIEMTNVRLTREIRDNRDEKQLIYDAKVEAALQKYIAKCARLSWRLVVQTPPLRIDYSAKTFDSSKHGNLKGQQEPSSSQCIVYHWPTLMQGHNVLVKAEVKAVSKKSTSLFSRITGCNPGTNV